MTGPQHVVPGLDPGMPSLRERHAAHRLPARPPHLREPDMTDPTPLVSRMFNAIDARAWTDFAAIFHPAIAYYRPGYPPMTGLDRLLRFYDHERIIARGAHRLEQVIAGHDGALAAWGHFEGVTRTGDAVSEDFSEIYTVIDGRLACRRTFFYRPAI